MCNFDLREIVEKNLNKENKFWNFPIIIFFTSIIFSILYLICTIRKLPIYFWKKFIYHNIFIDKNNSQLVMIEGPWGIGKTYIFNKQIKPIIENIYKKNVIYTSLFGIKDKQEIKNKIVDQYIDNKYSIVSKFFLIIGIGFPTIYSLLCFFNPKLLYNMNYSFYFQDIHLFYFTYNTFKCITFISILYDLLLIIKICPLNYLIKMLDNKYLGTGFSLQNAELDHLFNNKKDIFVFDDLERISDTADIKEIIGFLNDLRDVYQFNVIVIANEEELEKRKDNKFEYKYFREKFNPAKFEIEYKEEIVNHLIEKEENENVKYLIEKVVKPLCGKENTETTTSNLRVIKRFIEIISDTYKYAKKDNVICIDEITINNIQEILNYPIDNIFFIKKGLNKFNIIKNSIENSLDFTFRTYVKHLYYLNCKYHNENYQNDNEFEMGCIERSDISNIYKNDIINSFFMTKIQLLINIYNNYKELISSNDLFISKIIECSKQINSFELLDTIYYLFKKLGCLNEFNSKWIKNILQNILENLGINKKSVSDIQNICTNYTTSIKEKDDLFFYIQDYVVSKLKEFMDIDDLSSADIVNFLFGSLKLLEKDPSIISKIIDNSKDDKICMYIISNLEVQRWEQVVSKNDRALCIKSLRYLYSKLPNEQKEYYKAEFFDKHPEILESQNI